MKPANFDYYDPATLDEALSLLYQYGDDAKVLAGGQSLVPLMNMRLAKPAVIVDINRLSEADYIEPRRGGVAIGALTRHRSVERSTLLKDVCPLLPHAAQHVADLQVRNRGTFGGSMAHADPASEFCAVALTLGARVQATGKKGPRHKRASRWMQAQEFFTGPLMTALDPTELVTQVYLPGFSGAWSFRSVEPRNGDLAIAGVMVALDLDGDGLCRQARIGMFGVGPTPLRATRAEEILKGYRLDDRLIAEAAEQASTEAEPVSDVRASAEYRTELVKRLVAWNLAKALGEAKSRGGK